MILLGLFACFLSDHGDLFKGICLEEAVTDMNQSERTKHSSYEKEEDLVSRSQNKNHFMCLERNCILHSTFTTDVMLKEHPKRLKMNTPIQDLICAK